MKTDPSMMMVGITAIYIEKFYEIELRVDAFRTRTFVTQNVTILLIPYYCGI